jgi:hypothetical protein
MVVCRRGLCRAAAKRAAMFDGDVSRSKRSSSGRPSVLELKLLGLLPACMGDRLGRVVLRLLRVLPPVHWVPTFVAATRAPLLPPVYVFAIGPGAEGGFEKASEAPCSAALWTLNCVSLGCGLGWCLGCMSLHSAHRYDVGS